MDALTAAAASGIRARIQSLDLLANNLSNSSAAGFKSDRESYGLYLSDDATDSPAGTNPAILPVIQNRWTDFSQGNLLPTASDTDLALNGKGFFIATTPTGPLYTRDGSFRISSTGQLITQQGYPVQGTDGKPIALDSSKTFQVGTDGAVQQDGQPVAQVAVVDFQDSNGLSKRGGNYFYSDAKPAPATSTEIQQGRLEQGNTESAQSAARLVTIMRQFESLQKAMTIGSDMNRRAIEEVAKVG